MQLILVSECVALQQDDIVTLPDGFSHEGVKGRINLDTEDGAGLVGEASRQAARAAADLDGQVVVRQLGGAGEQVDKVEVDEEVLAQLVPGPNAVRLEQVAKIGERLPRRRWRWS